MARKNKPIPRTVDRKKLAMCNYIKDSIDKTLPYMYSAVALALWNVLDETDEEKRQDIATLINESQIVWTECVNEGKSIIDLCEEVTGFDIRTGSQRGEYE